MDKKLVSRLPRILKVRITKGKSAFLAELPELGVFTEADTMIDLHLAINDLIYCYYDIPKKDQKNIYYLPFNRVIPAATQVNTGISLKAFVSTDVVPEFPYSFL